jgi:hypothetical protein
MALTTDFIDAASIAATGFPGPHVYPWPTEGNPAGFVSFASFQQWREFIFQLGVRDSLPDIVRAKFETAQKLYLLGWLDVDVLKAGEFAALSCLELSLKDRYGDRVKGKGGHISFGHLLRYMAEHDGLANEMLPVCRRSGGDLVSDLKSRNPSASFLRNREAHADPYNTAPYSGVLEVVRDLIEFAYRDWP